MKIFNVILVKEYKEIDIGTVKHREVISCGYFTDMKSAREKLNYLCNLHKGHGYVTSQEVEFVQTYKE